MSLTELAIKHAKPKAVSYRINDGKSLHLEITPSGGKIWRWRYYLHGKQQILSLGKYPAVSLAAARKKRDEAQALVEAGKSPARERKINNLRSKVAGDNTFEQVARKWHDLRSEKLNPKYHKQCISRMEELVFPAIGKLPVSDIRTPEIVAVIEDIGDRGTIETAKKMKQMICQVFRYARQRGLCDNNPASDLRDILPSAKPKHFACIPINEANQLLQAIEARKDDFSKYAIQLLALTFVRTGELIGARWDGEIDWEKSEWHIPATRMKMKRPHVVPLSKQALATFKKLHEKTGRTPFVFYSPASKSKHISNGTVLMALRRMGYKGKMTGHGFRTLASTILNEKGYAPDIIERQLAHEEENKIRAAYNRAEYLAERKKMMQDYADMLDEMRRDKVKPFAPSQYSSVKIV